MIKIYRFLSEKTSINTIPTIGMPHSFNTFQLSDGSLVNVNIIDTAGQEKHRALSSQYYRKADGCLLVYDITQRESFEEIKGYFYEQIKEKCKENIKIIVLGNKTDLEEKRKVSCEEGSNFAAEKGFMFLETSCLKNSYVADSFETLIELTYRDAVERNQTNLSEKGITINNNSPKSTKKKSGLCC